MAQKTIYDLIGIGIGPSNLSLAALLKPIQLTYLFFEAKNEFQWHESMLFDDSLVQVHYLKDCVTLVDPTNPYSFLSFLTEHKRLYQFLNKKCSFVSRKEFNQYYRWVSKKIPQLKFGESVTSVDFQDNIFEIQTNKRNYFAKHLVLGTGQVPYIPQKFTEVLSEKVFHCSEYNKKIECFKNKLPSKIAVIGGGQSGAEIVDQLLSFSNAPTSIIWASKRLNFQPIDDSCFANEFYTPSYSKYFYNLPAEKKTKLLAEQILTSDGISMDLINSIYRRIYEIKFVLQHDIDIHPIARSNLVQIVNENKAFELIFHDLTYNTYRSYYADMIIFATGYRPRLPDCMASLLELIDMDAQNKPVINLDYSLRWKYSSHNKIFIQNGAIHTHGIADPNLSLASWRSAIIINSLARKAFYDANPSTPILKQTYCPGDLFESHQYITEKMLQDTA